MLSVINGRFKGVYTWFKTTLREVVVIALFTKTALFNGRLWRVKRGPKGKGLSEVQRERTWGEATGQPKDGR